MILDRKKQISSPNTFPVDDVVSAGKPIWTESLNVSLDKRFKRKIFFVPEAERSVINALFEVPRVGPPVANPLVESLLSSAVGIREKLFLRSPDRTAVSRRHPLMHAVETAFNQHRPLTLSPDCIWLVLAQGFAHHIAENAEAMRSRLVRHEGKREILTELGEFSLAGFQSAIAAISLQIRGQTDPVLHESLICDFSTTTPEIRTASEITLMDCYGNYFDYVMSFVCGIPKITVTGTLDDWQRIRARVEVLETYNLGWWVARLRPILDEFIRTVEGAPDLRFWQAIYKPKRAYGATSVTGWIADLFPYLGDSPGRQRNHVLKHDREDWAIPVEKGVNHSFGGEPGAEKGAALDRFPSGLASAPVKLVFPNEGRKDIDLVAGFFAVEQEPKTLSLSPLISWAVTEPAPKEPITI